MTGASLSVAVGMHRAAASGLEAGGRVPRVDTLEKLAKVLGVSPCYLAYGADVPCLAQTGTLFADLPQRLSAMRQERGLSRLELGRLSDTSHTFVRMTETGTTVPNIAKVEQLAKALNVSVCWLAFGIGQAELPAGRRVRSDTPPSPDPRT
ncbi:MAG: helix-turn-helix transcriptional regulator [Myxococcales bacterium]|jgi:transcriptional regulator with XRE-family HTH domain|nr:helix-turn-helix transcriptional regulator [Myxococcales bacterium]